jgi:hypothetical protein
MFLELPCIGIMYLYRGKYTFPGVLCLKSQIPSIDGFVKSPKTVMPDLIPAKDGIFDRHPELIEIIRLRRTFARMTKKVNSRLFTSSSSIKLQINHKTQILNRVETIVTLFAILNLVTRSAGTAC